MVAYSTRGGTSAKTLRVTSPAASSSLSSLASIFWETPATARLSSLKRRGPPRRRAQTMSIFHLPPTASSAASSPE